MIYSVHKLNYTKIPNKPILDDMFEVGCEVWINGKIFKLSDVVLGKYFLVSRQEKGLHGEVYRVNSQRGFELCLSTYKETGRVTNSTYKILEKEFVNEALKFLMIEELSVGEERYIIKQSKANEI